MGQELQEAQDKLLKKRAMLNQTESRGQRIENTDFKEIADRCMEKAKNGDGKVMEFKSEFKEPNTKKQPVRSTNIHNIPKAYQECSFENYQGNDKLINDLNKLTAINIEGVVLRGNTGCGKTHLALALAKKIPTEWQNIKGGWDIMPGTIFTTVPELLLKIRSSFKDGAKETEDQLINYYSGCELLILDDLGAEKTSEFAITTLYIILDRRIRDCRKTIITTNMSKEEIESTFGSRVASRLIGMENIKINMPDHRKKRG